MTVNAILKDKGREVHSLAPTDRVRDAVATLSEKRIGALLVMHEQDRIAGILSERDIVRELAKRGSDVLDESVAAIMTSKVRSCSPSDTIARVMEMMTEGRFRHLPVLEDGTLVGFISIGDVVRRRIGEVEQEAADIRDYVAAGG